MTGHYLLTLKERKGLDVFHTQHLIRADNEQKVKYHYHRTLKDWGWTNTQYQDKHNLKRDNLEASIEQIRELTGAEYVFLKDFLQEWVKV
jgi:hypothetical protein